MKEGFIVVNKPRGITSFGVVSFLRKKTGLRKIGHCGTLDPLASGVLICAIGRSATKKIDILRDQVKEYIAEIELGKESTTYDLEGEIRNISFSENIELEDIKKVLQFFVGHISQMPPAFSAKKIKGVRAYKLARAGKRVQLKKNKVFVKSINILSYKWPILKIKVVCGKGTYIRSLAYDVGRKLKCGGILHSLIRSKVGDIGIKNSVSLEKINEKNWQRFLMDGILEKKKKLLH